jgi:hypothetical protein
MIKIDLTIAKGAIFSEDRKYRYLLWRVWKSDPTIRLQIGLNPSTANEYTNDPTIIRSAQRAYADGFGGFIQANLYGYSSANPNILLGDGDFIGIDNDAYLKEAIALSSQVICGWGSFSPVIKRAPVVLKMIPNPYCLGVNKDGQPKHPLYISYKTKVIRYLVEL